MRDELFWLITPNMAKSLLNQVSFKYRRDYAVLVDRTKNGKIVLKLRKFKDNARLAQLVEHITDTDGVLGSNPRSRTK